MEGLQAWYANIDTADVLAVAWQVLGAILIFIIGRWIAKSHHQGHARSHDQAGNGPAAGQFPWHDWFMYSCCYR